MPDEAITSCGNCRNYDPSTNKCLKGHDKFYKYMAHSCCDDFRKLQESKMNASQVTANFFGGFRTPNKVVEVITATSDIVSYAYQLREHPIDPNVVSVRKNNMRLTQGVDYSVMDDVVTFHHVAHIQAGDEITLEYRA